MNTVAKLGAVGAVVVVAAAVIAWSQTPQRKDAQQAAPAASAQKPIPKLVDLGAGKCIPCKAMAPILEKLRVDYAGRLDVQFIDVWKDPNAGEQYGIRTIPTQIFYAADGRELARHEGFIDREQILDQFKALGVSL
jgi:thioredoxin 1